MAAARRLPLPTLAAALLGAAAVGWGATLGCGSSEQPSGTAAPWSSGLGGAAAGGATSSGAGAPGGGGLGPGGADAGSSSGGDLGWPFDDDVPVPCPANPPDLSGAPWAGWANVQHPPSLETTVGQQTEPIYGRVYAEGQTPAPGAAPGWAAELLIGPYGTDPLADGRCWRAEAAAFNIDVGNDDEYLADTAPAAAGLFGILYRFRPPGGAWRYGDLDGSDNGSSPAQAARLLVRDPTATGSLVVATLNLRCRMDDWPARRPLVVTALARIAPDLVALQEDCAELGGAPQSEELRAELGAYLGHGFELVRSATHVASDGAQQFEEGISVMSAHPLDAARVLDLPYVHFPRRAIAVDVTVDGSPLRFYATHFDYGADAADAREQSAQLLLTDWPTDRPAVLGGDLNAEPAEAGAATFRAVLADLWRVANPGALGLTMPAPEPTRRIDYLLGSPSLAAAVRGAKLLDEHDQTHWLSDHRGVGVALSGVGAR